MKSTILKALLGLGFGIGYFSAHAQSITPTAGNRSEYEASPQKEAVMFSAPTVAQPTPEKNKTATAMPAKPQAVQRDLTPAEREEAARAQKTLSREALMRDIHTQVTAEPGSRAAVKQEYALVKARLDALQTARGEESEPSAEETLLKERMAQLMETLDR
jgi:hypothetical protein